MSVWRSGCRSKLVLGGWNPIVAGPAADQCDIAAGVLVAKACVVTLHLHKPGHSPSLQARKEGCMRGRAITMAHAVLFKLTTAAICCVTSSLSVQALACCAVWRHTLARFMTCFKVENTACVAVDWVEGL